MKKNENSKSDEEYECVVRIETLESKFGPFTSEDPAREYATIVNERIRKQKMGIFEDGYLGTLQFGSYLEKKTLKARDLLWYEDDNIGDLNYEETYQDFLKTINMWIDRGFPDVVCQGILVSTHYLEDWIEETSIQRGNTSRAIGIHLKTRRFFDAGLLAERLGRPNLALQIYRKGINYYTDLEGEMADKKPVSCYERNIGPRRELCERNLKDLSQKNTTAPKPSSKN